MDQYVLIVWRQFQKINIDGLVSVFVQIENREQAVLFDGAGQDIVDD